MLMNTNPDIQQNLSESTNNDNVPNIPDSVNDELTENVLKKVDLMNFNNGWNDKNERIVISIGENAASYKWMHEKCASNQRIIYNITNISLIILSTSLTAETIFTDNSNYTFEIIRRVFVYIVNLITVLQTFFKSEETCEKHISAANAYSTFYHDIQQQMCMFRRDRINAKKYVSKCLKYYDSLILNNPDISSNVLKKFKSTFKNSDISLPDIADKIQKIEVINEDVYIQNDGGLSQNKRGNLYTEQDNSQNEPGNSQNERGNSQKQRGNLQIGGNYAKSKNNKNLQDCNNLLKIHDAFQIHGDISDQDLENINTNQLRELRVKFLQQKSNYEYARFLQNSHEND